MFSGTWRITLFDNTTSVDIKGGEFGLVFIADGLGVSDKGHSAQYPEDVETVIIAAPPKDNLIPPHIVLHDGPCTYLEVPGSHGGAGYPHGHYY